MSEVSEPKNPVTTDEDTVQDVRPLADRKSESKAVEPDTNGEGKTEPAGPVEMGSPAPSASAEEASESLPIVLRVFGRTDVGLTRALNCS